MKTKLTLLLAALAFTGVSYAGPSDAAAFAIRHARESAARDQGQQVTQASNDSRSVTYVPSSSGKGLVQSGSRDEQVTNIALFKSTKTGTGHSGGACCATKR